MVGKVSGGAGNAIQSQIERAKRQTPIPAKIQITEAPETVAPQDVNQTEGVEETQEIDESQEAQPQQESREVSSFQASQGYQTVDSASHEHLNLKMNSLKKEIHEMKENNQTNTPKFMENMAELSKIKVKLIEIKRSQEH